MTEELHGADRELHLIKTKLKNALDDIEGVVEDTEATLVHYGRWTHERASVLFKEIDEHLHHAAHRSEDKAKSVGTEDAEHYHKLAIRLHALRADMNEKVESFDEGTAHDEIAKAVDEFHDRVDEHLEWMRASGREW